MKIASVKKVWDTSEQETEDTNGISFGAPLDTAFKGSDAQDDAHHEGFSPGGNQSASTTNVCKVIIISKCMLIANIILISNCYI